MKLSFDKLFIEHLEFTSSTFIKATPEGVLEHAKKEIKEALEDIKYKVPKQRLAIEYADCLGCLIDSANRSGIDPHMLAMAFNDKLQINKGRTWKDNGDGSYSHIKQ